MSGDARDFNNIVVIIVFIVFIVITLKRREYSPASGFFLYFAFIY